MNKFEIITFPLFNEDKGSLIPFELDAQFPFPVKRVYLVTAKDHTVTRGAHAHLIEEEVFVAASGTITAIVNDGAGDQEIQLDSPQKGLIIRKNCWHEFKNFSPDAVMLCFSSTHYLPGETNYVYDKDEFLEKTK